MKCNAENEEFQKKRAVTLDRNERKQTIRIFVLLQRKTTHDASVDLASGNKREG